MVKYRNNIHVPLAVQALELTFHPLILGWIIGNIGIESHNKSVAVPERIGRIAPQPAMRAVGRNELGHRGEIIPQPLLSSRIIQFLSHRDVMVAWS